MSLIGSAAEIINGYADINPSAGTMGVGKSPSSTDFDYGYFEVNAESGKHPFAVRAWQHIRANQPELMDGDMNFTLLDPLGQIKMLQSIAGSLRSLFMSYYTACDDANWGEKIWSDKAWIRLKSSDKVKYGGGLRVKQVTMVDQWQEDTEGVYGEVYDYTTTDVDGITPISSGVAAYEPIAGGDENAVHYAKKYTESIPLASSNNLFFEYPINEACYPGPQVGYRQGNGDESRLSCLGKKTILNAPNVFPNLANGESLNVGKNSA